MRTLEKTCMNFKVFDFNGCEIIKLINDSIDYSKAVSKSIFDVMDLLCQVSQQLSSNRIRDELALIKIQRIVEEMPPINLSFSKSEKKPKYIRQQHKLAQRHFRRK